MERVCPVESYPRIEQTGHDAQGIFAEDGGYPRFEHESGITQGDDGSALADPSATVYGQYGLAGLHWHTIKDHCFDGFFSIPGHIIANTTFEWSKAIGSNTIKIYSQVVGGNVLNLISLQIAEIMEELRDVVWRPLLPSIAILGAAWMAYTGLIKKRFLLTVEGLVWMVVGTTLSLWLLSTPKVAMEAADTLASGASAGVNNAVHAVMSERMGGGRDCPPRAYDEDSPADVSEEHSGLPDKADWENYNHYFVRINSEMQYRNFLCEPWMVGYFGTSIPGDMMKIDHGMDLLDAQAFSQSDIRSVDSQDMNTGDTEAYDEYVTSKNEQYQEVRDDIQQTTPMIYPVFAGENQMHRMGVANSALFINLVNAAVVWTLSFAILIVKVAMLLGFLMFPFIAIACSFPGEWGKMVLFRWFGTMLGLLLKQMILSLIMAMFTGISGSMMGHNTFGAVMVMVTFILAVVIYRRNFSDMFAATSGNRVMDRATTTASQMREIGTGAATLPPVAYMRSQQWAWRHKGKIAAGAAVASGGGAALAGASGAGGAVSGASKRRPSSGSGSGGAGDTGPDPTSGGPDGGTGGRGGGSGPSPAPDESGPSPRPRVRAAEASGPEDAPPLPMGSSTSRAKGMLGSGSSRRRDDAPGLDQPDTPRPRPTTRAPLPLDGTRGDAGSAPHRTRRPEDAPPPPPSVRFGNVRGSAARQWRRPDRLRDAVPWMVPTRKRFTPRKLFPFGDRKGGK